MAISDVLGFISNGVADQKQKLFTNLVDSMQRLKRTLATLAFS